jgi:hypothetical protein
MAVNPTLNHPPGQAVSAVNLENPASILINPILASTLSIKRRRRTLNLILSPQCHKNTSTPHLGIKMSPINLF